MSFTFLRNATLIDGYGGDPIPHAALLVEDNRIAAAGPEATVRQATRNASEHMTETNATSR